MTIKHSLANYPKEFLQCVVTRNKICLQFGNVDVKLRYKEGGEYMKLPCTTKAFPIPITGTKVDITSVGCPLHVIFSMLDDVIGALGQQFDLHLNEKEKKEFILNVESLSTYVAQLVVDMKKELACQKRDRRIAHSQQKQGK